MQTKTMSAIEAACNIGSGVFIAWLVTIFLLPVMLDVEIAKGEALEVTLVYTAISLVRSYIWRRFFNGKVKNYAGV